LEHPEARTTGGIGSVIKETLPDRHLNDEAKRTILREAVERFENELMDGEERLVLLDRIKRIRRRLGL
jgi:hypothetical protein